MSLMLSCAAVNVLLHSFPTRRSSDLVSQNSVAGKERVFAGSSSRISRSTSLDQVCRPGRSEEHTSELQSLRHLVCRLLLEKKIESEYSEMEDVVATGACMTSDRMATA